MFADREGGILWTMLRICGVYHGFMPTSVESVPAERYLPG